MRTAFKCRAYPDPEQAAVFGRTFGCVRLVWNKALAERHRAWHTDGKPSSYKETDAALTGWKKTQDLAFLSEVSSVPLQQALRHQHTAFANFFAGRARYPRFKNRNSRQSAHYTRSAFRLKDGQLWMAKTRAPLAWTCPGCRTRHDRDHNAAKNILAAGRAVTGACPGDVCGADVRRQGSSLPQSAAKQKRPRREP